MPKDAVLGLLSNFKECQETQINAKECQWILQGTEIVTTRDNFM